VYLYQASGLAAEEPQEVVPLFSSPRAMGRASAQASLTGAATRSWGTALRGFRGTADAGASPEAASSRLATSFPRVRSLRRSERRLAELVKPALELVEALAQARSLAPQAGAVSARLAGGLFEPLLNLAVELLDALVQHRRGRRHYRFTIRSCRLCLDGGDAGQKQNDETDDG
jgi:hypothetical protein